MPGAPPPESVIVFVRVFFSGLDLVVVPPVSCSPSQVHVLFRHRQREIQVHGGEVEFQGSCVRGSLRSTGAGEIVAISTKRIAETAIDPRGIMGIRDIEIERVSAVHHSKIGLESVVELFDDARAE